MSARTATPNSSWRIPPIGLFIILIVIGLTFLGLVTLFSASQSMHDDPTVLLKKQLIWLVLATIAGGIALMVNLEALREYAYWLAAGSVLLLALVLIPGIGVEVNGARRWMDFGIMRLQVSEIGKLGLIFSMAHYLATYRRDFNRVLKGYFYPCVFLLSLIHI